MLDTCLCFPCEMEPGYCLYLPILTMVVLQASQMESQCQRAEQYGVSKTTIANIKKNEHSITNSVESNCSQNRKRKMRKTENKEVNNIMLEFFIKCRA